MAEEHDSWCFSVLGVNVGGALQKAGSAIGSAASTALHDAEAVGSAIGHGTAVVGSAIVDEGKAVIAGAENLAHKAAHAVTDAGQKIAAKAHDALHPDEAKLKACVALDDEFEKQMKRIVDQVAKVTAAGLDPGHLTAKARELRADHDKVKAEKDLDARQRDMKALVAQATQEADRDTADTTRGTTSAVEGIDKAVTDMRTSIAKLIDKLDKKNDQKLQLAKRLDELDKEIESERKEQDRAKRNKLLKLAQRDAEALLDDAATAAKDTNVVQDTYKQALMDRYGFAVSEKAGVSTHNDRVYKMFELTPDLDKTQEKLTVLKYDDTMPGGAHNPSAFYWGGDGKTQTPEIVMGQYDGKETLPYLNPDSKQPETPNAFDISTLHELGHSVDDRFGLMNKYGSGDAAGGWATEKVEDVTSRYVDRFKTGHGKAHPLRDDILTGSVQATFNAGVVTVSGGATQDEQKALAGLLATCASRVAGRPWEKEDSIGGRSYHRNGKVWVSYSTASRGKALNVSLYQWRSPAEFFAELYAWTFYNSKPPPGPVEKGLKAYMYGGEAAQPPAKN